MVVNVADTKRVLIFPAGSEIGLEVYASLKFNKHFELVAASSISSHASALFPGEVLYLPQVGDETFFDELGKLVKNFEIDLIYPAHDEVILALTRNIDKVNATVVCSAPEVCEVTQYKRRTYDLFADQDFVPKVYAERSEVKKFPVFVKPSRGQNSIGAEVVHTAEQLDEKLARMSDPVVADYLSGQEYTVDCFSDRHGKLHFCQARKRLRTKYGISMHSANHAASQEKIEFIANRILERLPIRGGWFFQIKEDTNGELKLLEIAPRIAGTSVTARYGGVSLPSLSVYDAMGLDVSIVDNNIDVEIERALVNRVISRETFSGLVLDFDDTLITPNFCVNTEVLALAYQYKSQNKPIYLVTRHKDDIYLALEGYHLAINLFDEIHHLVNGEKKSDFFPKVGRVLFVDDSYRERSNVMNELDNVVAVDVDAVLGFIDYKQ